MKNNPEYVEINNKKYKINSDFRTILRCNEIANDEDIGDYERPLAIIYLMYGDEGLKDTKHHKELLEMALKFISKNQLKEQEDDEVDMDFVQDFNFIKASFKSDYDIDLTKENLHWWDFYDYLNGLSENCVLNRIREIRRYDLSEISNEKDKKRMAKAQKEYALKRKSKVSKKQQESADKFYKLTGIKRR